MKMAARPKRKMRGASEVFMLENMSDLQGRGLNGNGYATLLRRTASPLTTGWIIRRSYRTGQRLKSFLFTNQSSELFTFGLSIQSPRDITGKTTIDCPRTLVDHLP